VKKGEGEEREEEEEKKRKEGVRKKGGLKDTGGRSRPFFIFLLSIVVGRKVGIMRVTDSESFLCFYLILRSD
jgi:hypothetical protein